MKRREFLRMVAALPMATAMPRVFAGVEGLDNPWRTFEMSYELDLSSHKGAGKLWLPLPQDLGDYQKVSSLSWSDNVRGVRMVRDPVYGANIFSLSWDKTQVSPHFKVSAQVATRDRDTASAAQCEQSIAGESLYLQPTKNMPVDGIVAATTKGIVKDSMPVDEKARAIYEWVVDNTFREPKTRGCGLGDIKFMLETGDLGGKCADINSLFVGLARAAGIPAREVYGVRVANSTLFKSLGSSGDISKGHHCRAEYFSPRHGWTPVDPADVRKVVLQEKLELDDPKVVELREHLFGNWEMNWVGFNTARDFALPAAGSKGTPSASDIIPYLMYPYAEIGDKVLDGRDPAAFSFKLSSKML